ncbi:MAG: Clp protease N-terminal domain-containing protein, partial [Desulfovibrionaceae bacterium]|nr:Clp protease N-terminal domain-containing protein [Desulfovibrionaceae bacterium]
MDPNRFTQKTQEAVAAAQSLAVKSGHQQVDAEHLLLALAGQEQGLIPRILDKAGVDARAYAAALKDEIARLPKVGGPGARPDQVVVTPRLQAAFVRAEDLAKGLKDEYISVEHLFLALLDEPAGSAAGRVNRRFNLDKDKVYAALNEVRGHQRVTSDNPEATYDSLKKYGRDLVA